jgi:two-component system chemotaxis response regulator CheB
MIVDDSALMRKLLSQLLSRDPGIEVIDTAMDGQFALDHLARVRPDVVLMDVDMPRLDGLSALDRMVADHGLPVVMCSARTTAGAQATVDALARGAVDFIEKPTLAALTSGAATAEIVARIRGAATARVRARRKIPDAAIHQTPAAENRTGPASAPVSPDTLTSIEQVAQMARRAAPEIVAIGTSTGGPPALEQVLGALPASFPLGLVIVQHMPAGFTRLLASHLDRTSAITVREAADGEMVRPGVALIAPGGAHLRVVRTGSGYAVQIDDQTPPVSGHRPSVDVLFESVAGATRGHAVAVLMTGMGSDGAQNLGRLAGAGAVTIAQAPSSCICHGMPKSAIDRGHARAVLLLDEIGSAINICGAAASH